MKSDSLVILISNQYPSLESNRSGYIKIGTQGIIIASRHLPSDPEKCYLVKFSGHAGNRHVRSTWIKEVF